MPKKAILLDLDNTVYPVASIGDQLFADLFQLIEASGEHRPDMDAIRQDIMRIPFQLVAARYHFSEKLTTDGMNLLKDLAYTGPIKPFADYQALRMLPIDKFLITTGFQKLQQSKVDGMAITDDFKAIYIVDPAISSKTKKDVFAEIAANYHYDLQDLLVVGDDMQSEIKAARELGIDWVLYDKINRHANEGLQNRITDFKDLVRWL